MPPTEDPTGLAPRRAALRLLNGIAEGRTLTDTKLEPLAPADRARALRLALTTCRQMGRADRVLKPFLQKRPKEQVTTILRLGLVEMAEGAPAHGVVNAMVTLAGEDRRTSSAKGLINAVLRKAETPPEAWAKLPVPTLPKWIRRPLTDAWGQRAIQRIETVQMAAPPLDLTAKYPEVTAQATGGTLLPTGSVRLADAGQVTDLPGYATGDWWVQDAAAALPVRMLNPQKGDRILDLCAAPGGKTMQLAAAGAEVTSVDSSEARLTLVEENLARTGLTARLVTADALTFTEDGWDAILLDAPCSATGTMRRHPDLPLARDGAEIGGLIDLQAQLLDHALSLLKPGGRLVFCTCSLLPDEGEVQVDEALTRHPGLTVDRTWTERSWADPEWLSEEGGLRTRPDHWADIGGLDGFCSACLTKPA